MALTLDARAAQLLKLLIERYVRDGLPVGSRTLARSFGLQLSPATVRNVMADLEEQGFVCSPHTSAGRVPTQRGYRYFVDTLLSPQELSDEERQQLAGELLGQEMDRSPQRLAEAASTLLSRLSSMAAVVTVARRNWATLRHIQFLPLSDRRVLAILVVNQSEVQNRILQMDRDYEAAELERLSNLINERFATHDLLRVRQQLLEDALHAQTEVGRLLNDAAAIMQRALGEQDDETCIIAGGANLMGFQELTELNRLRNLFDALDRKRDLLQLFDQCLSASGVQIFIGHESGYKVLDECSVVTARYYVDGQVAGVLGVIGPTRMAYHRIIPLVAGTALLVGQGLKSES